ncbi:MAG: UPF0149 family protein [Gammaproteobacteria bacterium]|nr:UPF0149 family protein [Gammaproteobacteria bacterium]
MTGVDDFNYARLQSSLASADVGVGASETHGIVCGAICNQIKSGREQDLNALIARDAWTEPGTVGLLEGPIRSVYQLASTMLHQGDAEFMLLLPDQQTSLAERTAALASWCRGFMFGLLHNDAFAIEQLPGDAEEIARDFLVFSDAESGDTPSEDDERALVEIEEYIRVGVQLIFEELYAEHPDGRPAGGVH